MTMPKERASHGCGTNTNTPGSKVLTPDFTNPCGMKRQVRKG
jgi:hypothetical protein